MTFDKDTYWKRRKAGQRGQDPITLDNPATEQNEQSRPARRRKLNRFNREMKRRLDKFKREELQ